MGKGRELQGTFVNKPDVNKIMKALCEVLSMQDGGMYEYTYTLERKEDKENA